MAFNQSILSGGKNLYFICVFLTDVIWRQISTIGCNYWVTPVFTLCDEQLYLIVIHQFHSK